MHRPRLLAAAAAVLLCASALRAGPIAYLADNRAMSVVGHVGGTPVNVLRTASTPFGPILAADVLANGVAGAHQTTIFTSAGIEASGGAGWSTYLTGPFFVGVVTNIFDITFQITEPAYYTLSGEVGAYYAGPFTFSGLGVTATSQLPVPPYYYQDFSASGLLLPGVYNIRAQGDILLDAPAAEKGGSGNYRFSFTTTTVPDGGSALVALGVSLAVLGALHRRSIARSVPGV